MWLVAVDSRSIQRMMEDEWWYMVSCMAATRSHTSEIHQSHRHLCANLEFSRSRLVSVSEGRFAIGRSVGRPLLVHFFSYSCSFRQKSYQIIGFHHFSGVAPFGKSRIRHCLHIISWWSLIWLHLLLMKKRNSLLGYSRNEVHFWAIPETRFTSGLFQKWGSFHLPKYNEAILWF